MLLQRRSNDEYWPLAWSKRDLWAVGRAVEQAEAAGDTLRHQHEFSASRRGTATALRAIDEAWGGGYYMIDPQAETDPEAADAAFGGDELVIDVQTHYIARHRAGAAGVEGIMGFIRDVAPDRWRGLDPAIHLDLGNYLRHIFLESETAAAVLTCTPGDDRHSILTNPEISATRELIDRLAGTGRLINHSIVHPNAPGELDQMETLMERGKPAGWKVYTIAGWGDQPGWRLDDEECGLPFLEVARIGDHPPVVVLSRL